MTIESTRLEIPRDRWKRPLVIPEGGGKPVGYTRTTTFIGCLEDTYKLSQWSQRHLARGVALHEELRQAVLDTDPNDREALNEVCDLAKERDGASDAAKIGTYMHAVTEAADRGGDPGQVPVPDLAMVTMGPLDYLADLAAYLTATGALTPLMIEQFCVLDTMKIGGTPDRVVRYQGETYIADLKTGNIEYGALKIAMQLAVYARSHTYDIATGERGVHGADTNKAIIIHLPAGEATCRLVWVDIKAGWEAVKIARDVREQRKIKFNDLCYQIGSAFDTPPPPPAVDIDSLDLTHRIQRAKTVEALGALWQQHLSEWTPSHTASAAARKAELLAVAR